MGKPGRKPKPTAIKIMAGNPGKRPLNCAEPTPPAGVPACPSCLDDEARKEWFRVVPILQTMRVLSPVDMATLAAYCSAYSEMQQAEALVVEHGIIIVTTSGYAQQHPAVTIRRAARDQVRKLAAEFGLTPSSRTQVHVIPDDQGAGETAKDQLKRDLNIA